MPPQDRMRPELDPENSEKIRSWERQLRERHGISMSPQRIVNVLIEGIDYFDIEQHLKVALKDPEPEVPKKKKQRLIVRTSLGSTRI